MAQGDTTVRIDFEVGGANDAKIRILDIYNASKKKQEELKNAAKAFSQAQGISYGDAMKAVRKYATEVENAARAQARAAAKPAPMTDEEKKQAESVRLLEQQRRFWQRKNLIDMHNDQKRAIREELAEKKRALREEERERRRIRRQEEAEARRAGGRGLGERLLGRTGHAALMGVAGYAGAGGIGSIISGIRDGIQSIIDKRAELETAITPLVMLDDNVSKMGGIRQEVLKTSIAMGRSYQEVGRFYADLVGSTGNLSEEQRDQLIKETKELADLTGGSLVEAQDLLTKSYQIYGSELKSVNELQNKLMQTQDKGSIEFSEMALRLPEVLQGGKTVGLSIDEVLGSVIGATRRSGSIEKTMTGLRNFFLIMERSQKKGVELTGTYSEKLKQISDLFITNRSKMDELFGNEVVVHAASIAEAFKEVSEEVKNLGLVTAETDSVAEKLAAKFSDPTYFSTRDIQAIRDTMESAGNLNPEAFRDSGLGRMHTRGLLSATAFRQKTGGIFGRIGDIPSYLWGQILPKQVLEGRDVVSSTQEGPQLQASIVQRAKEERDAERQFILNRAIFEAIVPGPDIIAAPWAITSDWIKSKRPNQNLAREQAKLDSMSGSMTGAVSAEDKKTHDLLAESNRLLADIAKPKTMPKAGGSRSNYEEAI